MGKVVKPQYFSHDFAHNLSSFLTGSSSQLEIALAFHPYEAGKLGMQLAGGQCVACILKL